PDYPEIQGFLDYYHNTQLDATLCAQLSDAGFLVLAQTLSRCEQITDEGVRYLGSSTFAVENLRVLELDNCPSITDSSIDHLLTCRSLKRLDVFDCQQITKNAVKKIQTRYPELNIHAYFTPRTPTPTGRGRHQQSHISIIKKN
ncbi:unnamed protein product, partial [Didymodactylos carnosus]